METGPPIKRTKLDEQSETETEGESVASVPWTPIADPFPQSSATPHQSGVQDTTPGLRANVQGPYQGVGSSFCPSVYQAYSSTPRPHQHPHPLMQRFTIPGEGTSGSNMPQRTVSLHNVSMPLQPVFTSPPAWTIGRAKQQSSQYDDQSFILHGLGEGTSDGNTSQTTVSVHNLSMPLQPVVFTSPQLGGAEKQSDRETATPANMLQASIFQGCNAPAPVRSEAFNVTMTCHSHMQDTAEYQTIKKCAPELKIATQHTLTKLSGHLLSRGLITADQYGELGNIMHSESDRAAKLISLILNKVELAPKYYSVFINALKEDKLNNEVVLKLLERTYSSLTSGGLMRNSVSTELFRVSAMAKLNEYLILTQSQVSTKKFPNLPNLPNKKFIALAVIEKEYVNRENADAFTKGTLHGHPDEILKKKEPIILEAVLEPPEGQQNVKLVFVEGAPGVGKSTLALELCRRQKEIKAMAKYSLVLLFQLRDKDVQEIQTIEGLFHHDDISLQWSVTKEVIDCNGKNVLFILDGFDELPSNLRRDSFFVKLIQGKHLPASTVLVTSRPSASAEILQSVNDYKYIEVLGFTQNQVEQYAMSMLNDQPVVLEDFLKYIFVNPAIRGMMYVPLNSAIVLHIYRKNRTKSKTFFPRTMTQLYTELCLVLLIKYLKEKNESDPLITELLNTNNLGDLPESIKDQMFMLGELAFKGALSQEITFEQLPNGCDDLGLLNVSTGLYLGRKSYSFLHLTLQEFLAGYYFSHLSPVEQELKFVNNLVINDIRSKSGIKLRNHLDVMWRFVAGLNGFKNIGWGLAYDASNWRWTKDRTSTPCTPFLIRCLFEVQDVKEIKSACDSILITTECPNISLSLSNHLDCYAAGYCIAVSGHKWNLNMCFIEGNEVLEMLCCGLKSAENISGSILDLNLAGNSLTVAAMSYLRELQTIGILPQIHFLSLCDNKLNNCAFDDFAEIVTSMVNLTSLRVDGNPVGGSGMVKFFQNLPQISTLTELHVEDINLDLTDIQALSEMMASIKCLTKLNIGDPRMLDKSVIEVVKVLLSPTSLKDVTFRGIFWTHKRAENFALLKKNNNIANLTFERNYDHDFILDPVIPAIAEALHENKSLQILKMPPCNHPDDVEDDVNIRHESIVVLSRMLRVNTTLKRLDVFVSLTCEDIAFLSDALRFNYTLQTLNVGNRRIHVSRCSDED